MVYLKSVIGHSIIYKIYPADFQFLACVLMLWHFIDKGFLCVATPNSSGVKYFVWVEGV